MKKPSLFSTLKKVSYALSALFLSQTYSCSSTGEDAGTVTLILTTDLPAPKGIDAVGIFIFKNGETKLQTVQRVKTDGSVALPASLILADIDKARPSVHTRIVAFQKNSLGNYEPRTIRDSFLKMPGVGKHVVLRMPLLWANSDKQGISLSGQIIRQADVEFYEQQFQALSLNQKVNLLDSPSQTDTLLYPESWGNGCSALWTSGENSVNQQLDQGNCVSVPLIDAETLPTLPSGGFLKTFESSGTQDCFDPQTCFASSVAPEVLVAEKQPNTNCRFRAPSRPIVNLAIELEPNQCGSISTSSSRCIHPFTLDQKDWTIEDGFVKLPPKVCASALGARQIIATTTTSAACPSLSQDMILCAPWASSLTPLSP